MNTNEKLSGKVALVTGGSRGIGAAIVARLAGDGAKVAFTYVGSSTQADELARSITAGGGTALAIAADSGDESAVRRAVTRVVEELGRLDILVNNAGLALGGTLDAMTMEGIDRMIAVNLRGPVIAIQEALRHLRDGGRIVNIGSSNSAFFPVPGASIYTMTKSGLAGLTKGLARELGPRGITVNTVQPGPTNTDMNPENGELAKHVRGLIAVQRYARPAEISSLVAYLASPEASFVTGADLKADGGLSA